MTGTGEYGLDLGAVTKLVMACDVTVLIDLDLNNDGVSSSNSAVDFAMMLSGSLTPTFEIDLGDEEPEELDFSAVFETNSDFYMVSSFLLI